ncbi:MFS transporter [Hyphomonas sp.]|uniref:MFS transporter n=1 Tax=Hyphomonas sp. TaxID=87 RepID=UPI003918D805
MKLSDSWRATLAASCVHLVMGANLPYLPVWMEKIAGMSGAEIAGASTIAMIIRIVAGPLAAGIAQDRGLRATLASAMAVSFAGYALLFPDSPRAVDFLLCVLIYSALNVAGPLFEAILVYGTRAGRPDYGQGRALVSLAFVIANLAGGAILGAFGPNWVLAYLVLTAAMATAAPLFTKQGARQVVPKRTLVSTFRDGFALYRIDGVFPFIMAAALIQATHGAYYAFASNIWIAQGIGGGHIGALWATGVGAEILLLLVSSRLLGGFTPQALLWIGGLGAVLRWLLAGFVLPVETVYAQQTLHALTFAVTHIATMRFLQASLPDDKLPLAYAVNGALVFGPIMAVTSLVAGLAYDTLAPGGIAAQTRLYWIMIPVAVAGLVVARSTSRVPAAP